VLVWFRRTRHPAVVGLAALHLGIAVMLQNVTFFTLSMACSFWVFVPGETTRRLGAALQSAGRSLLGARPARSPRRRRDPPARPVGGPLGLVKPAECLSPIVLTSRLLPARTPFPE